MLSPTSLSSLSISPRFVRPVRAVNPTASQSQGGTRIPMAPVPLTLPGAGQDGTPPPRGLPRGSLLDISV